LHLVDDMVVGDDEPPAIDDDTGPHPAHPGPLALLARERPSAGGGRLLLAGDADHAGWPCGPPRRPGLTRRDVGRRDGDRPISVTPTDIATSQKSPSRRILGSGTLEPLGLVWPTTRASRRVPFRQGPPCPSESAGTALTRLPTCFDRPPFDPSCDRLARPPTGFCPFPQDPQTYPGRTDVAAKPRGKWPVVRRLPIKPARTPESRSADSRPFG